MSKKTRVQKTDSVSSKKKTKKIKKKPETPHKWRLCPYGEHWVTTHPLHVPPSKKNPEGSITSRKGHCAQNPSGKDQLYPDEIKAIVENQFDVLENKPSYLKFKNASKYDDLIAGWTQYWNEVLKPKFNLEPNMVKALIASESSFIPDLLANKSDPNSARGLMQITNKSRIILSDEKGEIKDHYLNLTREDLNDPSNNICAGIRWLFNKQKIASSLIKKNATWEEAIFEFKGCRTVPSQRAEELMNKYSDFLKKLSK